MMLMLVMLVTMITDNEAVASIAETTEYKE